MTLPLCRLCLERPAWVRSPVAGDVCFSCAVEAYKRAQRGTVMTEPTFRTEALHRAWVAWRLGKV